MNNNNNNDISPPIHLLNYEDVPVDALPETVRHNDHRELYLDADETPNTHNEERSKLSSSLLYVNDQQTVTTEDDSDLVGAYKDIRDLPDENYVNTDEQPETCYTVDTNQNRTLIQKPRTSSSPKNPTNDLLQWNTKFQKILDEGNKDHEKYLLDFHELSQEFEETASRIAVEIISSLVVDMETDSKKLSDLQRSVNKRIGIRTDALYKPDSTKGGVAGGIKFVENGIFFKLAVDSVGLYGGNEFSMKAATHELRSMKEVMKCDVPDLHVPIMTIIDWGGFRVLAQSFLPISPFTLKYGSDDGGKSMVNSSPKIESLVKQFAQKLNLKEHIIEWINSEGVAQKTSISGPADLEIHEGFDNRNYVVDCARLFPPEPRFYVLNVVFIPSEDFSSVKNIEINFNQWDKAVCGLLGVKSTSQLKRVWVQESELIYADYDHVDNSLINKRASYLAELSKESSDHASALSPLIFGDAIFIHGGKGGSFLYNLLRPELVAQGQPLSSDAFSRFGRNDFEKHNAEVQQAFSNMVTEVIPKLAKQLNDTSQLLLFQNHSRSISKLFHDHGIPMRMMENVRSQITNNVVQNLLLTEMVTRVLKNVFRSELRCLRSRDPFSLASFAVSFFNKVLGESTTASQFWSVLVYCHMLRKYGLEQQITTSGNSAHLQNVIHKPSLFSSLQHATGFRFRQEINDNAQQHPEIFSEENPFALFHLEGWDNTKVHSDNRDEVVQQLMKIQKPNVKSLMDPDAIYQIFEQKIQKIFHSTCYVDSAIEANKIVEGYTSLKETITKLRLDSIDLVKVYTLRSAFLLLKSQQYEKALATVQEFLPAHNKFGSTIHSELLVGSFYIAGSAFHGLHKYHEATEHFKTAITLLEKLHGSIRYNSFSHPFGLLLYNGLVESLLQHSTKVTEEIFRHSQHFLALLNFFHFTSQLKKTHTKFLFGQEIPACVQWLQVQDVMHSLEVRKYFPDNSTSTYSDSDFDRELQKILLFWNPLNFSGISTSPETLLSGSSVLPPASKPSPAAEKTISLLWGANFLGECLLSSSAFQKSSQYDFVDIPNSSETVFGGNVNIKDAQCGSMFTCFLFENGELWLAGMSAFDVRFIGLTSAQQFIENKKAINMWTKYEKLFIQTEDKELYEFAPKRKVPIPNQPEYSDIVQVAVGSSHHLILFASGKVLGWGTNHHGELRNAAESVVDPVEIETPPNEKVIQVAARRYTTAFVCESGSLYIFGQFSRCLGQGKIGELDLYDEDLPDPDRTAWNKVQFPGDAKVKQIAFGLYHALALTEDGKVYSWGHNGLGQLGIGSTTSQSFPRLVSFLNDEKITSVFAGSDLSYAITKSGKAYGWGEAVYGQLTTLSQKIIAIPRLITAFPVGCHILSVHIERQRIAAVAKVPVMEQQQGSSANENRKVFIKQSLADVENSNSLQQSASETRSDHPTKILHWGYLEHAFDCCWKEPISLKNLNPVKDADVTDVAVGKCHMLALNSQGKVFSFGQGTQGALGLGHTSTVKGQLAPIKFLADKVVTSICCGSHHSVALTNNGQVYSWGGGMPVDNMAEISFLEEYNMGQLGHGDTFMRTVPMMIKTLAGVRVTRISCGDWHTAAVTDTGDLYLWGENTNGRIGLPLDVPFSASPKKLPQDRTGRIAQVACGQAFTCVVNTRGEAYAFGCGSNGQLGNGEAKDSWEPVKVGGLEHVQVSKVACGRNHVIAVAIVAAAPLPLKDLTARYIMRKLPRYQSRLQSVPSDVLPVLEQQLEKELTQTYQHQLFAWGNCDRGQLGTGNDFEAASAIRKQIGFMKMRQQYPQGYFMSKPAQVQTEIFPPNFQVKDVQCGNNHTLCLLDDGSVFAWGSGTAGETGLGHLETIDSPQKVQFPEGKWIVKKIAAKFIVTEVVAVNYTNFKLLENNPQESTTPSNNSNTNTGHKKLMESTLVCYSV